MTPRTTLVASWCPKEPVSWVVASPLPVPDVSVPPGVGLADAEDAELDGLDADDPVVASSPSFNTTNEDPDEILLNSSGALGAGTPSGRVAGSTAIVYRPVPDTSSSIRPAASVVPEESPDVPLTTTSTPGTG
ncbi:hypothetical protein SDC9_137860 [bioreactor metagenome]|uniref:Uncharacterized protein n=1 Tax=bioreactor metagenome TaxID=1076179 RepID=A0A645DNR6_9ZZZZ